MSPVYIIFSDRLNKYYVGESVDFESRIVENNNGFYQNSFTSMATDWSLCQIIECESRVQARKIESHIKKMKSTKYIQNLKKYPEIISKLKEKYK